MRIGVISDSHGDMYGIKRAIRNMGEVDMIIHLGDNFRDAENISKELKREIICVKGNCDFSYRGECDKIISAGGKKLMLTHGHNYNVKSGYTSLYYKALEEGVDAVLFGHTHFAEVFENDSIIFINPGSLSRPKGPKSTYALVVVDGDMITPNIVEL